MAKAKRKRKAERKWVVSKEKDGARKARKQGKRVSASGETYYEYRWNRADDKPNAPKGKKLAKGGILNKKVTLKDIFSGK